MSAGIKDPAARGSAGVIRRRALGILIAVVLLVPLTCRADDATTQPDAPSVSPEQLAAEARFRERLHQLITINAKAEPLEWTLAAVSRQAMVPISVDWENAFGSQAKRDCPISLQLLNVPADRVLALILRCATDARGSSEPKLYVDADGAHVVADLPQPDGNQAAKTVEARYDVADLVRALRTGGRRTEDCFDDLNKLIEETIAPDTWLETGGSVGKVYVAPLHPAPRTAADDPDEPQRGGSDARDPLVVTTTPDLQAEVAELLSKLRNGIAGMPPTLPAPFMRTAAAMRRSIPANFKLLPLADVLDSIRRSAHINLFVDWLVLNDNGITPQTLVTTPAAPNGMLPAAEAMSAVLKAGSESGNAEMHWDIGLDGIVQVYLVAQPSDERPVVTCCYNIRTLLQMPAPGKLWKAHAPVEARFDAIVTILQEQVDPDSWKELGGTTGSMKEVGTVLVVTQTLLNQEAVAQILQKLP